MRPALFFPVSLVLGCTPSSPEARVKQAFEACVAGIEKGDAEPVIERLDPAFAGPDGMDRNAAKLFLFGVLRREKIGVTVFAHKVEVRRKEATQTVELLLTSKGGGLIPNDASRRTLLLRWEEIKGDWKLREVVDQTGAIQP